jgi:hypothetical protein
MPPSSKEELTGCAKGHYGFVIEMSTSITIQRREGCRPLNLYTASDSVQKYLRRVKPASQR